jgi:exodeoxyribonuclease V alpha subunit
VTHDTIAADTEPDSISGTIESVVYHNDANYYTVCSVRVDGRKDPVTVVGTCPAVWVGETLKADGRWVRHKKHGLQLEAETMACVPPSSAKGIERFLAGGMIRGIGKVTAARLVKHFGDGTLRIIEKESARLEEVEGIGAHRRKLIKESWEEQKGVRDVMIFLQGHGIGAGKAARIVRQYKHHAIGLIRANPYRLCEEIWGIGFKTADAVAMSLGIPPESELRARAGLLHVLQTLADDGHCFCPEPELLLQAEVLLSIPVEILGDALCHQVDAGTLIRDDGRIYPAALYDAETGVADAVARLRNAARTFKPIDAAKAIDWAETRIGFALDIEQRRALETALAEKVAIITGGPGVGKTTIIRALVDVFRARKLNVMLAAPTGRAAKRMEEATGHEARTLHRLLRFMPATGQFEHDEDTPLEADVVILDEVSMIDITLMHSVMRALPDAACLVLVGDVDQLPSVGAGNVLSDLIESDVIPCVRLQTIFRQEAGSLIVQNAHRINRGEYVELPDPDDLSDFYFIQADNPDQAISLTLNLLTDRIPRRFDFDPLDEIQVLTPMRKNQLGADNLNAVFQAALNPSGAGIQRFGRHYRGGDRVMQIRNNYDKDVFNGDIGRISTVDTVDQVLTVEFDGRSIKYDFTELDELVHAYACSIHKAQGSEYPAVIILLMTQHFRLLQRNLLYTALTRGRRLVVLVGSRKALSIAIHNNEIKLRRTGLRDRLRAAAGRS